MVYVTKNVINQFSISMKAIVNVKKHIRVMGFVTQVVIILKIIEMAVIVLF